MIFIYYQSIYYDYVIIFFYPDHLNLNYATYKHYPFAKHILWLNTRFAHNMYVHMSSLLVSNEDVNLKILCGFYPNNIYF